MDIESWDERDGVFPDQFRHVGNRRRLGEVDDKESHRRSQSRK